MPHRFRSASPSLRRTAVLASTVAAVLAASCAQDPEISETAHDPGHRIRAFLDASDQPTLPFPGGDTVRFGPEVVEFYRNRDFRPAWTSEEGFSERGEVLVAELHRASDEGLDPDAYHRDLVHDLIDRAKGHHEDGLPVGSELGDLDMLLSEAFLRYTTDLRRGTLDPTEAGLRWQIEREDATDAAFLNSIVEAEDFEAAMDSVRPAVPFYGRLKEALAKYRAIRDRGGWPTVPDGETLGEGMTGERVVALRRRLVAEGDSAEARLARTEGDPSTFDADLARAVEHFQERHGIDKDGRVGGSTLQELNVPVEDRIAALRLNLDRWRWLPSDLGERYVFVNVAGFEAAVMKNDEPEFQTNVVVGQEGWETPLFRDTMEYVVVNPYWNVPRSIADEEVIPAARRDPGYLARNRYEVVSSGGRPVNPASVDLSSGAYSIRQRPGPGNALGEVKFLFPNDNNIYLHDTPANHLFSRSGRAFSHGCIRVEKPIELARYLFRTATSRSEEDFDRLRASDDEQWVELEQKLPVYIVYFTAWGEPDGAIRFYRDVYGRDREVQKIARVRLPEEAAPTGPKTPGAAGG